jgi:hypothetical protein
VAVVVAVAIVVGLFGPLGKWPPAKGPPPARPARPAPGGPPATLPVEPPTPTTAQARTTISPFPSTRPTGPAAQAEAAALLARGLDLLGRGRLLAARNDLGDALWSGGLAGQQADVARLRLTELADKTLFARTPYPDDPCALEYLVQANDVLDGERGVIRRLQLRVPADLILKVNGLASGGRLQPGMKLKMIRGPFHAAVSRTGYRMDVYLQESQSGRMIFVRRFPVGTGQDGATPPGRWRVALGGKLRHAAWTPPSSSNLPRKRILPGQPGYALGKQGLWISLEGIDGNPYTAEDGYGIHDTYDQDSVGKNTSLGCIRVRDGDIDQVFSMLYEYWSTVLVED